MKSIWTVFHRQQWVSAICKARQIRLLGPHYGNIKCLAGNEDNLHLQVGFGSGFKVNSAVWRALRSFKDPSHVAWASVSTADVDTMWADLQSMGVKFVNGAIPPHVSAKKAATH